MAIRKILNYQENVLHASAQEIERVDEETRNTITDLVDTLYSSTGVGIAAPQIGINKKIFIYDPTREAENQERNYKVLINARITGHSTDILPSKEGCKSTPDLFVNLSRFRKIRVEGMDETGNKVEFESEGIEAQVIQHEIDHIEGKLIYENESIEDKESGLYRNYARDTKDILNRIEFMQKFDDGEISTSQSSKNKIHIVKRGNQIQMYFSDGDKFSGIMSRIDLIHPLKLLGLYTQAIMLGLVFVENPKKIYMIGFGGGRIPMIFHHYFPDVIVESTEDDSEVISLAQRYFGVKEDNRMIVHNKDGRKFLESRESNKDYDIIIVDSFTGAGQHPFSLSSAEFYQICKKSSSDKSVVVTNLVESDPLFGSKVKTFINSFNFVYEFCDDGTHVFFGSDSINISNEDIVSKAKAIDDYYNFRFPLDKLSEEVRVLKSKDIIQNELYKGEILRDSENQTFKASRNDLCPCGSGKKFKKCHLLLNKS